MLYLIFEETISGVLKSSMYLVLKEGKFHPYELQHVHELNEDGSMIQIDVQNFVKT